MVEKLNFEEYWRSGGKLDRYSIERAESILSGQANEGKFRWQNSALLQARHMGVFSGVQITPEEEILYAVLRKITREDAGSFVSSSEEPGNILWTLSDQILLAEVIRLTGDAERFTRFKSVYPSIFPEVGFQS